MSRSQEQQLIDSVDISKFDQTEFLFIRVSIPKPLLDQFKWGLIVATISKNFQNITLYWDPETHEIVIGQNEPSIPMTALENVEKWFQDSLLSDESKCKQLESEAKAILADPSAAKRGRTEIDDASLASTIKQPYSTQNQPDAQSPLLLNPNAPKITLSHPALQYVSLTPSQSHPGHWEYVVSIDEDRVGQLIGNGGRTLRLLQHLTNSTVHFDKSERGDTESQRRRATILGNPQQIQSLIEEFRNVLVLTQPGDIHLASLGANATTDTHTIPGTHVGAVIGRGGETIRLLEIKTHCHLLMEKDDETNTGGTTPRKITIMGTADNIVKAKAAIDSLVKQYTAHMEQKPKERDFDAYEVLFGLCLNPRQSIVVDNGIVGLVIGSGGANVRRIKEQTQCTIQVDSNVSEPQRTITITANSESQLRQATQMLQQCVIQAQSRVGMMNNNDRNRGDGNNRMNNNNNNNNRRPQMDAQPRQVQGFGHQRPSMGSNNQMPNNMNMMQQQQQQQPQMNPQMMQQMMQMNPQMIAQMMAMMASQQQQQPAANLNVNMNRPPQQQQQQPQAAAAADDKPKPTKPVPADKMATWEHYVNHYRKTYPLDQAIQFAHHYIDNPQ